MKLNSVTSYEYEGRIAVVTIDAPPVNAIGADVRRGIADAMAKAAADPQVDAVVLMCAGKSFFPGADIAELSKPPVEPTLRQVEDIVEAMPKPVVAAMHGTALGGGLELAMCAHHRLAVPSTRFGLPEVRLGLLPGAGGTQRLPRIVGVPRALAMITSGQQIDAQTAKAEGLVDGIVDAGALRASAIAYATRIVAEAQPLTPVRDRNARLDEARAQPTLFADFRKANARNFRGFKAPEYAIRAVEAAVAQPFAEAMINERALFDELQTDSQSAAQRYLFFAERQAGKIAAEDGPALKIAKVGVIGAGTMGGGIAMNFLNAGIATRIIETRQEALDRGMAIIRKNYEATAAKGKMKAEEIGARMDLLTPSLALADLADCDLIIEAVFENLAVKQEVFRTLDAIAKPGAILATNTSYLDIDEIAAATQRPHSVLGLHFFSPANVMKLLEIVRTKDTSPAIVATAMQLAKTIGKIGVVVGNGYGFVGNRILAARNRQADRLILEGATPTDVDRVLYDFGFPMGHFQMRDLVGLDVGWNSADTHSANVREILNEMGRHGQKSGAGYYDYDQNRKASPSPRVKQVIEDFAAGQGIAQRRIEDEEISQRILLAMVNEAAHIVDEGIAARASDIDVVWVTGYGWPRYRGGPMFWADLQGLPNILAQLQMLEQSHGADFTPSRLIQRLAASGQGFNGASPYRAAA